MRTRFVNLRLPAGGDATAPSELLVEGPLFSRIGRAGEIPAPEGTVTVDLGGALVLPGVIDGHVHFDDPGFTHRETFATGTRAAAAGGVTCVVDMPCTSLPPVTSAERLAGKLAAVAPKAHVDYMMWGGVSGNAVAEGDWRRDVAGLAGAGVAAFKLYMLSGMETFRDLTPEELREALAAAAAAGVPAGVHAEAKGEVLERTERLRDGGHDGPLAYADSRPAAVEVSAVKLLASLARETGARAHVVHVAAGDALDAVAEARRSGVALSAETCPHYLAFTRDDLEAQGSVLKTAPVVKGAADRDRLWRGLASGDVQHVATDHAAGEWPREKTTGSIWTDYGGVPGVELLLPFLFSEGVGKGRVTLERLTELLSAAPARFFGVASRKGRIAEGLDADFTVLDDGAAFTVRAEELHNLNRYTPFEGWSLTGRVRQTWVRGTRVFARADDGSESFGPAGGGRFVRRQEPTG